MVNPLVPILLVVSALDKFGVPYFIGGSIASLSYGVVRTTLDANIVADLRDDMVDALVETLQESFYIDPAMIHSAIRRRGSFNVLHLDTMFKIDIFIPKSRPYDRVQFERRQTRAIGENEQDSVHFASPEDVILAKLEWYRLGNEISDRQWQDVLGVMKIRAKKLDLVYLTRWATELNIANLLQKALNEAHLD